jgi:phosphopantothenoylcysteine decarboxylase/phosphopantothenate--cysteine ligase
LTLLRERGVTIVGPDAGKLASRGEHGMGRLADPAVILERCEQLLGASGSWQGLRVLVTAGGTRAPIDSVRFLGNRSSGRMGLALAGAARRRGAEVTVIAANVALPVPESIDVRRVCTAAELAAACEQEFARCDVLLMAAAVADFRPVEAVEGKLKKAGRDGMLLELEATTDVLSALAARRSAGQVLVGFAAEHGERMLDYARSKLQSKGLDVVVANDISSADAGFDVEDNEVVVLTDADEVHLGRASKREIADGILDVVTRLREGPGAKVGDDGGAPVPQRLRALPTRM